MGCKSRTEGVNWPRGARYDPVSQREHALSRLSIILPAKNEAAALVDVLPRLKAAQPGAEILVVDDGSTDNTRAICLGAGVACISSPYSMGNGAAIKRGARAAKGEILVFMDGDGQHDPADIDRLVATLDTGLDRKSVG